MLYFCRAEKGGTYYYGLSLFAQKLLRFILFHLKIARGNNLLVMSNISPCSVLLIVKMICFLIGLLTIFCDTTMILCACCKKVTVEAASHKQCLQPLLCNVRIFNYELSTNSNCLACSQHISAMLNCEPSQHAAKIVITYEMVAVEVS
jgi:hypothetical protein